jgi:hypothetical protein
MKNDKTLKLEIEKLEKIYPPNKLIKFWWNSFWAYDDEFYKNPYKLSVGIIFILFNILAIIFESSKGWLFYTSLLIGNGYLAAIILFGFIAITLNNLRIRKIRKILNLSIIEYNKLVE